MSAPAAAERPPQQGARRAGRAALEVLAWLTLLATVLSAVLVAALAAWMSDAFDAGLLSRAVIDLDGSRFNLAQVPGEQWLLVAVLVFLAIVAALVVTALVLPLVVLVPLALAALACVAMVLLVAVVGALLLSPVILLVWVVRRLSRPRRPLATITQ